MPNFDTFGPVGRGFEGHWTLLFNANVLRVVFAASGCQVRQLVLGLASAKIGRRGRTRSMEATYFPP